MTDEDRGDRFRVEGMCLLVIMDKIMNWEPGFNHPISEGQCN